MYIRSVANSGKCLSVTFDDVRFMVFPDRSLNVRDCLLTADIFIPESKGGGGIHSDDTLRLVSVPVKNEYQRSIEKLFHKTLLDPHRREMSCITFSVSQNRTQQRNKTTDYWAMSYKYEAWLMDTQLHTAVEKPAVQCHFWHSAPQSSPIQAECKCVFGQTLDTQFVLNIFFWCNTELLPLLKHVGL